MLQFVDKFYSHIYETRIYAKGGSNGFKKKWVKMVTRNLISYAGKTSDNVWD